MRILLTFILVIISTLNASAVYTDIKWEKLSFPTDSSEIISLDQINNSSNLYWRLFAVTSKNELFRLKNNVSVKCPTGNLSVNSVVCVFPDKVFIGTDSGVFSFNRPRVLSDTIARLLLSRHNDEINQPLSVRTVLNMIW